MRKLLLPLLLTCCVCFFSADPAGAVGLGAYIEHGVGRSNFTIDNDDITWKLDTDKFRTAVGFVMDTTVARDSLFNYRLQLGLENWIEETDFRTRLELTGVALTQDFGFGVLRTPFMRLWLGPELRLAFASGSPHDNPSFDIYLFNYGIGPALGANFNIGTTLTLAVKAGYLFEGYLGRGETDTRTNGSFINPGSSAPRGQNDITYTGPSSQVFINFAILFRINDTYR